MPEVMRTLKTATVDLSSIRWHLLMERETKLTHPQDNIDGPFLVIREVERI
jgi:hypothetical protein